MHVLVVETCSLMCERELGWDLEFGGGHQHDSVQKEGKNSKRQPTDVDRGSR